MNVKKIVAVFAAVLSVAAAHAADYTFKRDINYKSGDEYVAERCRLDVAAPVGAHDAPVIVWFHGGGLTGGNKDIPRELLDGNVVVVGVGYRLSPRAAVTDIVDDAAAAVAWVFGNISMYGGSPERIYLAGHSAGGYLVDMVSLDKSRLKRYGVDANSIKGAIPFSGQVITHFEERRVRGISDRQPVVDSLAPLYHVRGDAPPMLILSGDREMEMLGRYEENAYFRRMLLLAGHKDVTLYEFDGYGHDMCGPGYPLLLRFVREREAARK